MTRMIGGEIFIEEKVGDDFDFGSRSVADLRVWIDATLALIPAHRRDSAYMEINNWDQGELQMFYLRPETTEEKAEREASETAYCDDKEQRERAELKRLKKKYELAR